MLKTCKNYILSLREMSRLRNISTLLMVVFILIQTVGINLIKDLCVPCQNETISVHIMYSDIESDCEDACHSYEEEHHSGHQHDGSSCKINHCEFFDHEHNIQTQRLTNAPEYFSKRTLDIEKLSPELITIFVPELFTKTLFSSNHGKTSLVCLHELPSDNHTQSILCTYLI